MTEEPIVDPRVDPVTSAPGAVPSRSARVYGVSYAVFDDDAGGTLYVTQYGLPLLEYLRPEAWYANGRYASHGQRMAAGTGTVYRLKVIEDPVHPLDLVIKFSRFAQDVPLDIRSTFDGSIDESVAEQARFLDPFQEFGLLRDLRRSHFGPAHLRIRTKRPLAIYKAPVPEPAWQLGRKTRFVQEARREIEIDQVASLTPVSLEADRTYVVLFHWVRGLNLLEAQEAGLLSPEAIEPITRHVAEQLRVKGFLVLDHKPQHVIVRPVEGGLLQHRDELAYAIVDFELLERTREYQQFLQDRRGNRDAGSPDASR